MSTKTIQELDEASTGDENTIIPMDTGIQTYKITLPNWIKAGRGLETVTSTERDAIVSPYTGQEVFNTDQFCKQIWTGSNWINIGDQTGALIAAGLSSAPEGYLACDGASYLRASYPDLFGKIGTAFGSADGTHFNVPNTQRRALVGAGGSGTGTLGNAIGNSGGEETHTLLTTEMPAHTHTFGQTFNSNVGGGAITIQDNDGNTNVTGSTGGGAAHNNIQPSLVTAHWIKI